MPKAKIDGNYFVEPTSTARSRAWKLCDNRMRENQRLRRHSRKLMFWPNSSGEEEEADLNWDWIKTLENKNIGELRIDEPINGHDNVRVVFWKPKIHMGEEAFNRIWLLTVFQKKRQGFTSPELKAFKGMRDLLVQRKYGGSSQA